MWLNFLPPEATQLNSMITNDLGEVESTGVELPEIQMKLTQMQSTQQYCASAHIEKKEKATFSVFCNLNLILILSYSIRVSIYMPSQVRSKAPSINPF